MIRVFLAGRLASATAATTAASAAFKVFRCGQSSEFEGFAHVHGDLCDHSVESFLSVHEVSGHFVGLEFIELLFVTGDFVFGNLASVLLLLQFFAELGEGAVLGLGIVAGEKSFDLRNVLLVFSRLENERAKLAGLFENR